MKIIEPIKRDNTVRVDEIQREHGFRKYDEREMEWDYFVAMDGNSSNLIIKRTRNRSMVNHVLVFNVKTGTAGLVKADEMVEPVELEVNVIAKGSSYEYRDLNTPEEEKVRMDRFS